MKEKIVWIFVVLYLCSFHLNAQNVENNPTGGGYQVAAEGAWCWFADPRALHYENKEGTINKTYIGYIDIHGNIKAMQYDFQKKEQEEVLIRSYFQPDDHNNPTFLVLPDERIMIFYSRHTDEPCFYYRVSRIPGDITTLGEEKRIETKIIRLILLRLFCRMILNIFIYAGVESVGIRLLPSFHYRTTKMRWM